MLVTFIVIWCLIGTTSILWLSWDYEAITWGDLVFSIILGSLIGPAVWVIIGLKILFQANFWGKPIFGKSK